MNNEQANNGCGQSNSSTCCEKPIRKVDKLPPWKVLLHNDDVNEAEFVLKKIRELTTLNKQDATTRVMEAHEHDIALLLTTHQERAELFVDQFETYGITVTAEKA